MAVFASIMADDLTLARKRLRALEHDAPAATAARARAASAAAELELLHSKKSPASSPPPPEIATVSYAFAAPRSLLATAKSLLARGDVAKARSSLERVVAAWDGSKTPTARAARALLKKLVNRR